VGPACRIGGAIEVEIAVLEDVRLASGDPPGHLSGDAISNDVPRTCRYAQRIRELAVRAGRKVVGRARYATFGGGASTDTRIGIAGALSCARRTLEASLAYLRSAWIFERMPTRVRVVHGKR